MELLIFRHGPAGDKEKWKAAGRPDAERPLTPDGKLKTAKAAAGLAAVYPRLDVVATSPLRRARQTAELLLRRYGGTALVELRELSPGTDPRRTIAALAGLAPARHVALVGHEPHLSALVAALTGGGALELKKAGACLLEADRLAPGAARLLWLLRPSQLRALR
jgi:phosphohistidine phosphatase